MERTHELSLTANMIGQLALEASFRGVTIGELIAALIMAVVNKDLLPLVLDNIVPGVPGEVCAGQRVVP